MRRDVDSAVFLCRRETENVVVLVYRSAYCAKRVVAVWENVGERELFKSARLCGLNNADVGYIVRCHSIELDVKKRIVSRYVMRGEYRVCNSVFARFFYRKSALVREFSVLVENAAVCKLYHFDFCLSF